ncbi:overexpressor of cationic peroxidase 3 [Wolffia australiana]
MGRRLPFCSSFEDYPSSSQRLPIPPQSLPVPVPLAWAWTRRNWLMGRLRPRSRSSKFENVFIFIELSEDFYPENQELVSSAMASRVVLPRGLGLLEGRLCSSGLRLATSSVCPSSRFAASLSIRRFPRLVARARRGKKASPPAENRTKKKDKKSAPADGEIDENGMDEDAFEKLFAQLEEDLKNENLSFDDLDDEISVEELEELERELAAALGDDDGDEDDDVDDDDEDSEDEEEIRMPKLRNWQLRRLATALKTGRRKTNIKALSAELGLERAVVLECLREPPPDLLLMAATLPDKKAEEETPKPIKEDAHVEPSSAPEEAPEPAAKAAPVHAMKAQWSANKRLKKVQLETLERVYARSKRPTNAMISSIVHTTNLPRKTVVKWFEEKRLQVGEPEPRRPFRRSEQTTVFS